MMLAVQRRSSKSSMLTPEERERFWKKVDVRGPDECWLWTAGCIPSGYGSFHLRGRTCYPHRIAWVEANGPVPDGLEVMHSCDVRHCVNPGHLSVGTGAENIRQMIERGRQVTLRGDAHGSSKITEEQVRAIRTARGLTQSELAREFEISQGHVSDIIRRKKWAHL
jgi:hypothetical protein